MTSTAGASLESLSLSDQASAPALADADAPVNGAPEVDGADGTAKAKKKKKKLTAAQKRARDEAKRIAPVAAVPAPGPVAVLKISRNKHMKYISSYHGPWLQLPYEVLTSFLQVNCDPSALPTLRGLMDLKSSLAGRAHSPSRIKSIASARSTSPGEAHYPAYADPEYDAPSDRLPPPIDPAVFRGVAEIRRLVDEASDLAVRAASGFASSGGGIGGREDDSLLGGGTGRQAKLSPVRIHRMRALAVGKLAAAYRIDEIAASVAVMQGATGLDDLAQRVLRYDSGSADAQYVHFFHEKIPSRTLAASTDTTLLDNLILGDPNRLEFYRTRGIVHGFKQDYPSSIRNFTAALASAKSLRKAREAASAAPAKSRKSKKPLSAASKLAAAAAAAASWDTPSSDTSSGGGGASVPAGDQASGIGHEAGDDLERQMLFHRGMAHFHFACKTVEDAVLEIEEVPLPAGGLSNEGGELTLRNVGIVLRDENGGLWGNAGPKKRARYERELNAPQLKDKVNSLLRKSLRDMERFLAYFAIWEAPPGSILEEERKAQSTGGPPSRTTDKPLTFRGRRLIHHRSLSGRTRACDPRREEVRSGEEGTEPALLTTYHPLLIEAHFCVLLNLILLGDFTELLPAYNRAVRLMDYLAGYPVFLEARSLNMSEFAELLERLAGTWAVAREAGGVLPPSGGEAEVVRTGELGALHHLLGFYSDEFVKAVVEEAERADLAQREEEELAKAAGNGKGPKLLEGPKPAEGEKRGGWKEERDRLEAERRKIDPSYATYNTARAEVALVWIQVTVLSQMERDERGAQATQGSSSGVNGGGSQQMGSGSGSASGSGALAGEMFGSAVPMGERSERRSSSSEGQPSASAKGKGKGKGRAVDE